MSLDSSSDHKSNEAPLSTEAQDYKKIDHHELVAEALLSLKEDQAPLFLATQCGRNCGRSVLADIHSDTLSIHTPIDFAENTASPFRIYFQNNRNFWHYFVTKILRESSTHLKTSYPDILFQIQRRSFERTKAPKGTTSFFYHNDNLLYGGTVIDLSANGMLVCTGDTEVINIGNPTLNDISIALPQEETSLRKIKSEDSSSLLMVNKGTIVRTFHDPETKYFCHGISFESDNTLREEFDTFVNKIQPGSDKL